MSSLAPIRRPAALALSVLLALGSASAATAAAKKTTKKKAAKATTTKATATTKASTSATAAPATTAAAAAPASSGAKGTLRIASFTDIPSFDPIKSQLTHAPYLNVVYDTLLRRDAKGNPAPGLAESWSKPNARTVRFNLRSGVKFTDGTPLDAAAVKWNLDRARSTPTNPNVGVFLGITAVNVVDSNTVDVSFNTVSPAFLVEMGSIASAMASPKSGDMTRAPIGTGGWIFDKAASQEGAKYVFNANPDWWDKANQHFAKIEISVVADNAARFNAMKTGQVDMVDVVMSDQRDDAKKAGWKVITTSDQVVPFLLGDRKGELVPALSKREVRQAMQLAVDGNAYTKAVLAGSGSPEPTFWPVDGQWNSPENAKRYAYNINRAKTLMRDAGYPNGFEMSVPAFATTKAANEAFATLMSEINIKVNIVQVAPGTAGALFRQKKYPAVYGPASVTDPYSWWATFISPDSPWNPFDIDNSILNTLAARAIAAPDDAARKKAYKELEQALQDEGVAVILAHADTITALPSTAKGSPFLYSGERCIRPYLLDFPVS